MLDIFGKSECNGRSKNEDAFYISTHRIGDQKIDIMCVCDGIGSLEDSDKVSFDLAVGVVGRIIAGISGFLLSRAGGDEEKNNFLEYIKKQILLTENFLIKKYYPKTIGTTITLLIVVNETECYLVDCGDSPCYLLTQNGMSLLSELMNYEGDKHILVKAVGQILEDNENKLHTAIFELQADEMIVLGSDGGFSSMEQGMLYRMLQNKKHSLKERIDNIFLCNRELSGETDNQTMVIACKTEEQA